MASRKEPGLTNKHSVDPAVAKPYSVEEDVPHTHNPANTDDVHKRGIGKVIVEFSDHDDGFLKMRRALDSSDLHLTWTWSVGKQAGKYVYVRVFAWQIAYGLELLLEKLHDVETGQRRATPDKLGHRP
jgi:hypothetical protein